MDINIALTISENYIEYARVTITSILLNADRTDNYNFYILIDKISDEEKEKTEKLKAVGNCNFFFVIMNDKDFDRIHPNMKPSTCYRLQLPSKVNVNKILYLDSDIICKCNIKELYSIDITGYYMAAVEDILGECWGNLIGFKYDEGEQFINSGVLLMNLEKLRNDNMEEKFFEILFKRQSWDQDTLNMNCKGKILSLPITYNFMPFKERTRIVFKKKYIYYRRRFLEYEETYKNPKIIHYYNKPWKNSKLIFANEWISIKNLTNEICK